MTVVFVVIMIGAFGLAVALAIVGWKLVRHGSEAMDSRVELLRALAAEADLVPAPAGVTTAAVPVEEIERIDPVTTAEPVANLAYRRIEPPAHETTDAVPVFARLASFGAETAAIEEHSEWDSRLGHGSLGLSAASHVADVPAVVVPLVMAPARTPSRMPLVAAALAVVMLASAGTVYAVYRPQLISAAWRTPPDDRVPANTIPLELLSLSETTATDGTFTVTGLVGNPATSHAARGVAAVVYLFDREGHYFATARAPIDLASLAAGDQSPFVVKVPHGAGVARYRVGFRQSDGSVAAHVDKRGERVDGMTEGLTDARTLQGSKGSGGA
jgi:hypothetical protein